MEDYSRKDDRCPQLLDLIPKEREWLVKKSEETSHGVSEEKKLELSLGPPGGSWTLKDKSQNEKDHESPISFGYFSNNPCVQNPVMKSPWQQQTKTPFLHLQSTHPQAQGQLHVKRESSQLCSNRAALDLQSAEKKAFSPATANIAVPNSSSAQKRTAPAPVVGWPPIRSFRKNLSSGSSSKLASDSPNEPLNKASGQNPSELCPKTTLFVKINMDGVPIGRKVNLKSYHSYEKLSYAVDELFRGLLAAQSDSCTGGIKDKEDRGKAMGGLLNGSGEYTLVYEDNEGDRMLVGDVPWHMFVSTVKRLRVLKSSELPTLYRGSKEGKLSLDAALK